MSDIFQYVLYFCFAFTVVSGCAFLLLLVWMRWPYTKEERKMLDDLSPLSNSRRGAWSSYDYDAMVFRELRAKDRARRARR